MIHSEQVQNRRVIVHVDFVFDGLIAVFVGFAERNSRLHAAAREPDRESIWIMIATIFAFGKWRDQGARLNPNSKTGERTEQQTAFSFLLSLE